jgi:hypothetical protein
VVAKFTYGNQGAKRLYSFDMSASGTTAQPNSLKIRVSSSTAYVLCFLVSPRVACMRSCLTTIEGLLRLQLSDEEDSYQQHSGS